MVYIMVSKRFVENALFLPGACKKLLNDVQKNEEELQGINKYPIVAQNTLKPALTLQINELKKQLNAECRGSEIITLY